MLFNLYLKAYKKVLLISILLWLFTVNNVYAGDYVPLEALPGVSGSGTSLSEYLSAIFNIGIGLAGVFAVLMIVVGGIQYIAGASNPSSRSEAKKKITNAIFGLILASSSWLILYTINPNLLKNALNISSVSISTPKPLVSSPGITPPDKINTPIPTPISSSYRDNSTPYDPTLYSAPVSEYKPDKTSDFVFKKSNVSSLDDFSIVMNCISKEVSGECTGADINKDGVIDNLDLISVSSSKNSKQPLSYEIGVSYYRKNKASSSVSQLSDITMSDNIDTIKRCISKDISGDCANADINKDGVIDKTDLSALIDLFNKDSTAPVNIDTTNDYSIVNDCLSKDISGDCANADINKDGVIDFLDLQVLSGAFKYNVNGDKVIDLKKSKAIKYCFLKEPVDLMLPPDPPCDYGDPMSDCSTLPQVQSFPTKCVAEDNSDKILSRIEFNKMKEVIKGQSYNGKINLRGLYNALFNNDCADEYSTENCDLFDKPLLGRMIYSTLIQYDTNKDGMADFTGGDPLVDFNGDGVINSKDSSFIDFINKSILKDKGFLPIKFTFGGIEAWMFKSKGFTDRQVIDYCIGKPAIMDCAMADIDRSCSKVANTLTCDVTKTDLNKFDKEAPTFDLNGDGVVNFSNPSINNQQLSGSTTKSLLPSYKIVNLSTIKSCISKDISGDCANADINKDGVIDNLDVTTLSSMVISVSSSTPSLSP